MTDRSRTRQTDRAHVRDASSGPRSARAPRPRRRQRQPRAAERSEFGVTQRRCGGGGGRRRREGDATAMTGAGEETDDRYLGLATCVFPACAPAPSVRRRPSDPFSLSPSFFSLLFPSLYLAVSFESTEIRFPF